MQPRFLLFALTISIQTFHTGCSDIDLDDAEQMPSELNWLNPEQVLNLAGVAETYSPLGNLAELEATNAFFKDMGTTGRTCVSCHGPAGGWTASAANWLWLESGGTDPLFMFTHDNGVCPDADISTKSKRKKAMTLMLNRGATRSAVKILPTAEFEVMSIDDPYDCSATTLTSFFGYRKPNPSFSVSKKSSVTWAPAPQPDMRAALKAFMVGATQAHGLTTYVPTDAEQNQGADFMLHAYFAQMVDFLAGRLDDDGALGGPVHLANQEWHLGINHSSTGPTTRRVFTIYDAWLDIDPDDARNWIERIRLERRKLIAEGQEIFNSRQNAGGGTCSGCHNSPNVGSHSVYRLFDIGVVDIADPALPSIVLRNKTTNEQRIVTNLGRAAATGLWSDIGKMSVPILRGLSSRAPHFSSGQARTLRDVVDHYDQRFTFNFTSRERAALVAFLGAL